MTTQTQELYDKIYDALDEAFEELYDCDYGVICGKQAMYDVFGEKLDEILNG